MERIDEGARTSGKFSWSRSAFANAASKVSTQSIQSTTEASRARTPPSDDKAGCVAATLAVDPELGAGLEVEFVEGRGYRVESIRSSPGQPSMRVGDLLVEVNGRSLALTNEDDADEVLANELRHGVPLLLERSVEAQDEPPEVAPAASDAEEVTETAPASDTVPETSKLAALAAEKPAEEVPAPRSLAGLLNSLFGAPKGGHSDSAEDPAGLASREKQPEGGEWSSPENGEDKDADVEIVAPVWPEVEEEEKPQAIVPETVEEEDEEVMVFQKPEVKEEDPWLHSDPWQAALPSRKAKVEPEKAETEVMELEVEPESLSRAEVPTEVGCEQLDAAPNPEIEGSNPQEVQDIPEDPETADAVPSASSASATKERSPPRRSTVRCKVTDLEEWLQELRLEEYVDAAAKWCAEMGAVSLEEIAENIEDFGVDISLKPIERQRVQKWAAQQLQGAVPLQKLAIEEPSRPSRGVARGAVAQRSLPGLWNDAERDWEAERGAERERRAETPVYTARSVRLAVDSQGNTGLDLRFDEDWGIRVQSVDPLPGQPGLAEGDFIVAIDGCSLRHRSHEECDQVFSERLQNGAILSVVRCSAPRESHTSVLAQNAAGYSRKTDLVPNWRLPRPDFRNSPNWSRQRRGGHDANRMWNRFSHRPPW